MRHSTAQKRARQIELLRTQFAQADGLAFADALPAERVEAALRETNATWRDCVYTPVLTLWAFLGQVISPDGSCRAAVARALAWLVSRGEPPCTPKTDPYCKARQRLLQRDLRAVLFRIDRLLDALAVRNLVLELAAPELMFLRNQPRFGKVALGSHLAEHSAYDLLKMIEKVRCLGNEIAHSCPERLDQELFVLKAGHQDGGSVVACLPYLTEQVQAAYRG